MNHRQQYLVREQQQQGAPPLSPRNSSSGSSNARKVGSPGHGTTTARKSSSMSSLAAYELKYHSNSHNSSHNSSGGSGGTASNKRIVATSSTYSPYFLLSTAAASSSSHNRSSALQTSTVTFDDVVGVNRVAKSSPKSTNDLISNVDFKAIDDMDPSMSEGHVLCFDREIPIELRAQDENENGEQSPDVGTLEAIRVKILLMEGDNQIFDVRVELTSESDLFFHYTHTCDREMFSQMKQRQDLMVDFSGYCKVLARMFTSCMKDPESFLCIFVMGRDGNSQLTFVQNMEYKFVELLTMDFTESPEHVVRQHITFRYNSLRSRVAIMSNKLQDVNAIVKLKNPSLLLELQKGSSSNISPSSSSGTFNSVSSIKRNRF